MHTCPECYLPLVPSFRMPGAWLCPAAWGDCSRSGAVA